MQGSNCLQSDRVASQNEQQSIYLFVVLFMLYCFVFVTKFVMLNKFHMCCATAVYASTKSSWASGKRKVLLVVKEKAGGCNYMEKGVTVTSVNYSNMLRNELRPAIRSKRRGRLT
jgi:hypothetical protein